MINFALVLQLSFGGLPCHSVELSLCGAIEPGTTRTRKEVPLDTGGEMSIKPSALSGSAPSKRLGVSR
jgi:hypothetical protein